jgi:hypothetical protein
VFAASNEIGNAHIQLSKSIATQIEGVIRDTRGIDDALKMVRRVFWNLRNSGKLTTFEPQESSISRSAKNFEEKIGNLRKVGLNTFCCGKPSKFNDLLPALQAKDKASKKSGSKTGKDRNRRGHRRASYNDRCRFSNIASLFVL